jgi:hypothetical protein
MSQVTHTHPPIVRSHRAAVLAAILALVAAAAVILVLALSDDSSGSRDSVVPVTQSQSVRPDGGPEESNVATAVDPPASVSARPDESRVADAISGR